MSLNKVILIGNVGRDPEVRYFDSGNAVANFTLATNERGYTLQNGTQVPERTDWHNIVLRGDRIQFVEKFVKKGSSVLIEGKLRYRDYEKDGVRRFVTEIVADRIEFYNSGARRDGTADGQQQAGASAPVQTQAPTPAPTQPSISSENPEDDLPF